MDWMEELYKTNPDFQSYIRGYCQEWGIDKETAFTHSMIKNIAEYYKDANRGKINVTEALYGCGSGSVKGGDTE